MEHDEKTVPEQKNSILEIVPHFDCTETDPETVRKAMDGDRDAFSTLFMRTYRKMYHTVSAILRRDEDIYDALQTGYAKAYKYISRLSSPEMFLPWLRKVMVNAARDVYMDMRTHGALSYEEQNAPAPAAPDSMADAERRTDMESVLSKMDPRRAEVLTLYFYDGLKLTEIARLLGEAKSTVYSRFRTAKKELAELLRARGIDSSLYSGGAGTMIAVCLRSLIGTDILSAVMAQKMLDDVLRGRPGKLEVSAYKLIENRRNRAILKAVSLLMAMTVAVSAVTAVLVHGMQAGRFPAAPPAVLAGEPASSRTVTTETAQSRTKTVPSATHLTDSKGTGSRTNKESGTAAPPAVNSLTIPLPPPASASGATSAEITKPSAAPTTSAARPAAFVPDYRPGKANTEMHIHMSSGWEWQDQWVYRFTNNGSYKFRRDGTGEKVVLPQELNTVLCPVVLGDWIYYWSYENDSIRRMRTDGAVVEVLAENALKGFYIRGQTVYYRKIVSGLIGSLTESRAYSLADNSDRATDSLWPNASEIGVVIGNCMLESGYRLWSPIYREKPFEWAGAGGLPLFKCGKTIYNVYGDSLTISDGPHPATGKAAISAKVFRIEFADEAGGRLAVTIYDDQGIKPLSMRWYSEASGLGDELPKVFWRHSPGQVYQSCADGYIFTTAADGKWFSCRPDGSDYTKYSA